MKTVENIPVCCRNIEIEKQSGRWIPAGAPRRFQDVPEMVYFAEWHFDKLDNFSKSRLTK
jgi:hypothetical protein